MAKTHSFETLQVLIEELTKDKPSQTRVRKLMQQNGLEYTPDSIQQMSSVLVLMSKMSPDVRKNKHKEKVSEL
jgi:hypothetical protein